MRHPLRGNLDTGNTLARNDEIVAVLDWDEAFVGAPELEPAAALKWGDDVTGPSEEFVAALARYRRLAGWVAVVSCRRRTISVIQTGANGDVQPGEVG